MFDLHAHVLPEIDDGAKDVAMSAQMLEEELKQGCSAVVATPHFKKTADLIPEFLEERKASVKKLADFYSENDIKHPTIYLGCEIYISPEILTSPLLPKLAVKKSGVGDLVLLEMRHGTNIYNVNAICDIVKKRDDVFPLYAHIERYLSSANDVKIVADLAKKGIAFQVNADSVISTDKSTKKIIDALFEARSVAIISSDAHNTTNYACRLRQAYDTVSERYGGDVAMRLLKNSEKILGF